MAHSIELLLDPATDAAIRSHWQALADAGLPSQLRVSSPTNRPHVTLLAAARIGAGVDEPLRALAGRLPFEAVVGAPAFFGGTRHTPPRRTLARLIVPSEQLLALHEEVYRLALPYLDGAPFAHCRPGHWTPHATLGRRLTEADVGPALTAIGAGGGELAARVVGLRRWDGDGRSEHLLAGWGDGSDGGTGARVH